MTNTISNTPSLTIATCSHNDHAIRSTSTAERPQLTSSLRHIIQQPALSISPSIYITHQPSSSSLPWKPFFYCSLIYSHPMFKVSHYVINLASRHVVLYAHVTHENLHLHIQRMQVLQVLHTPVYRLVFFHNILFPCVFFQAKFFTQSVLPLPYSCNHWFYTYCCLKTLTSTTLFHTECATISILPQPLALDMLLSQDLNLYHTV